MSAERRTARRIPYKAYVNRVQGGVSTVCRAFDLSRDGIGFQTLASSRLQEGEVVSVEFQLPTSERVLVARGRPARLAGDRIGIAFTHINPKTQAMIDGYIAAARIAVPGA